MPSRRAFLARLSALCAVPLAGCAAVDRRRRLDSLEPTVRAYVQALRWGRLDVAAALVRSRAESTPPYDMGALRAVKITASDLRIERIDEAGDEAIVTIVLDFQPADSSTVRVLTQHDTWWYDEARESWFIDGTLPLIPR